VADARRPPIDTPCGEGLLPEAVRGLRLLGIEPGLCSAFPLGGIRFTDEHSSSSAYIPRGTAYGMRRTALHQLLIERAREVGVTFLWGARIDHFDSDSARIDGGVVRFEWLVGADGLNSSVRAWAGLDPRRGSHARLGFRRHFAADAWTDVVEVYWGRRFEIVVTPIGAAEICVSFFTSDSILRIEQAIAQFPALAARMASARSLNSERGTVTSIQEPRAVVCGRAALVGDASCTVDGIAGQGMSLAFQQAVHLAGALAAGNLAQYESAHRQICKLPLRMARLLLLMDRSAWIRQKTLRIFAAMPGLFSKVISLHTNEPAGEPFTAKEIFDLGWRALRA
jgi:menaquinone-9 beta-reductase